MAVKVVTGPNTRFSYANVFEPKGINGSEPKFSVSVLIPKNDTETVAKIKSAIQQAYEEGKGKLASNGRPAPALNAIKTPLRDGDAEKPGDEAYAGCYFFNASSRQRPGVVDANCQQIIDPSEFYSGCFGRASVSFYAYSAQGSKGIAVGLNNLQKLRDGQRLGGGSTAAEDFGGGSAFGGADDFMS